MKSWTTACAAFLAMALLSYAATRFLLAGSGRGNMGDRAATTAVVEPGGTAAPVTGAAVLIGATVPEPGGSTVSSPAGAAVVDDSPAMSASVNGMTVVSGGDEKIRKMLTSKDGKELNEAGRLKRTMSLANLETLDQTGRLQPGTVELLGLDEDQTERVQRSFDDLTSRVSESLRKRLEMGPEATPESLAAKAEEKRKQQPEYSVEMSRMLSFHISAAPEEAAAAVAQQRQELEEIAGSAAAEALIEGAGGLLKYGAGQYEFRGDIEQGKWAGQQEQIVNIEGVDEKGKTVIKVGSTGGDSIRKYLGRALDDYMREDKRW